jgi:hypothetical protein
MTAGIDAATLVALSDVEHPVTLRREHWAIASRIDGPTYVHDLARACGLPLTEVLDRLSDLIEAGLCVATRAVSPPAGQQAAADILRQVLNGLRKLS